MHILLALFSLLFFFAMFIAFLVCCFVAWTIYKYFRDRKRQRALRLSSYQRRLKSVVAELLKQVNELDQISKYSGLDADAAWSKKYDDTLKKLLSANDKLVDAQTFVEMKELNATQESLLYVVRTIHIVNYRMKEMTPQENFDLLQQPVHDLVRPNKEGKARGVSSGAEKVVLREASALSPSSAVEGEAQKMLEDLERKAHDEPGSIIYLHSAEKKPE